MDKPMTLEELKGFFVLSAEVEADSGFSGWVELKWDHTARARALALLEELSTDSYTVYWRERAERQSAQIIHLLLQNKQLRQRIHRARLALGDESIEEPE